jgi:hypothetical protein
VVNGEQCKRYGKDISHQAAKQACDNAMVSEIYHHDSGLSAGFLGCPKNPKTYPA